MLNYITKSAYSGNMEGDAIPNGKNPKHRDEAMADVDVNPGNAVFDYLADETGTSSERGMELNASTMLTDQTDSVYVDENTKLTGYTLPKEANASAIRTPQIAPVKATDFNQQSKGHIANKADRFFNTQKLNNAWRTATFNNPLVGAGIIGTGTYLATKYLAPKLVGKIQNTMGIAAYNRDANGNAILEDGDDKFFATLFGVGAGALSMLPHFDKNRKGFGLFSYAPKTVQPQQPVLNYQNMNKNANLITPDNMIPIGMAREAIAGNDNLSPMTRMEAMGVLNAIPAPTENTPVSGNDILKAAVQNGLSAAGDAAIGYVTASALGLSNPLATAAGVGLTSFVLRDLFQEG